MKATIDTGAPRRLGRKTYLLFSLKRMHPAGGLFALSVVLLFLQRAALIFLKDPQSFIKFVSLLDTLILFTSMFFLFALAGAFFAAWLTYKNYTFAFEENSLKIRRGVFNKEEIEIPYRRIQNINIKRPLSYRLFGVSRLVVRTVEREASGKTDESEGVLPALDKDLAKAIEQTLISRVNVKEAQKEPVSS